MNSEEEWHLKAEDSEESFSDNKEFGEDLVKKRENEQEDNEEEDQKQEVSDEDDEPGYVEIGPVKRENFDFIKRLGAGGEFSSDVLTLHGSSNNLLVSRQMLFYILVTPYGIVFLVKKNCGIDKGKMYAMKVISKDLVVRANKTITHIKTERKVLELLRGCRYIPNLYYSFQTVDKLFLVLDYIPGGEMFTLLERESLDEARVRFYVAELVLALEHIHKHDIIYRDIKLENVLLDADGHIRLVDFGLCKHLGTKRRTNSFCGTHEYMAPEIVDRNGHDTAADWWSLGVLTIELLTKISPFGNTNDPNRSNEVMHRIIHGEPTMPQNISHEMKDFIHKMVQKDPIKRLGGNRKLATDIKSHPLFYGIDWNKLENKELPAPYKPTITDPFDVQNFNDEFTSQGADYDPSGIPKDTFLTFKGYSYIAPELERVDSHDLVNIDESLKAMSLDIFNNRKSNSEFFQKYNFTSDNPIGYGTTSVCMKCESLTNNNVYAVKIYHRRENCDIQIEVLQKCAVRKFNGIVRLIEVITDAKWTYLVMEFIDGVNLLQHLNNISFDGKYVCAIFAALYKIVKQVHSLKYSHSRVCFKNILCTENSAEIRLIGFSYAQRMTEIIDGNIDFWAIGVCLYTLLCGHSPFQMFIAEVANSNIAEVANSNIAEVANNIQDNTYNKESSTWTQLHEETRSLIDKLFRSTISNLSIRIMKSVANETFPSPLNNAELINENQKIISIRTIKKRPTSEVSEEENDDLAVLAENSVLNGDAILKNGNNSIESPDLHSTQQKSLNRKNKSRASLPTRSSKGINKVNASKQGTKSPKFTEGLSAQKALDQQVKNGESSREKRRKRKGDITSPPIKIEDCDKSEISEVENDSTPDAFKKRSSLRITNKIKKEANSSKINVTEVKLDPPPAKSMRINNVNPSTRRAKLPKLTDELSAQKRLDQKKKGAKGENIRETRRKSKKYDNISGRIKAERRDTSKVIDVEKHSTPSSSGAFKNISLVGGTNKIKKEPAASQKTNSAQVKLEDEGNLEPVRKSSTAEAKRFIQNTGTPKNSIKQTTKQVDKRLLLFDKSSPQVTYITYASTAKECVDRVQHVRWVERRQFVFPLRQRVSPYYTFDRIDYK